ncbi:MAG: hypothetical protein ABR508_00980 [Candidatus Baltobacteraceae bacterium]
MKVRILFTVLCIALLAACGGPADGTAFKAPDGWKSTPGIMGRFQMWMSGEQILMVIRGDKNMNLNDAEKAQPGTTNLRDVKQSNIVLCGKQPAQYFSGRGTSKTNGRTKDRFVEGVIATIGDGKFFAMYVRPSSAKADPQAETALHSLCKK